MRKFDEAVRLITEAVILPEPSATPQSLICGEKEQPRSGEPLPVRDKGGKRGGL